MEPARKKGIGRTGFSLSDFRLCEDQIKPRGREACATKIVRQPDEGQRFALFSALSLVPRKTPGRTVIPEVNVKAFPKHLML
jgi:hypothetical protein